MTNTAITTNTETKTASLAIYIDSVLVTTYTYDNEYVTLSQRINVDTVSLSDWRTIVDAIYKFVRYVNKELVPGTPPRELHLEKIKKNNNKIKADFEHETVLITDAEFTEGGSNIVFQSRPETVMVWSCFLAWVDFLDRLYKESANF